MIDGQNILIWSNMDTHQVLVLPREAPPPQGGGLWLHYFGAFDPKWRNMTSDERARLKTEFALDLAMQGFDLGTVLKAFAQVREFRALGAKSHPMCRALTKALIGETYDMATMGFEELLETYAPR